MPRIRPHFTEAEIARIKLLRERDGLTFTQLAVRFDSTGSSIQNMLQRVAKADAKDPT